MGMLHRNPREKARRGLRAYSRCSLTGPPAPPGFFPRVSVTFSVGLKFHGVRKMHPSEISKGHEKISAFPFEKPQAKVPSSFGYSRGKARERLPPWISKRRMVLGSWFFSGVPRLRELEKMSLRMFKGTWKRPYGTSKAHGNTYWIYQAEFIPLVSP